MENDLQEQLHRSREAEQAWKSKVDTLTRVKDQLEARAKGAKEKLETLKRGFSSQEREFKFLRQDLTTRLQGKEAYIAKLVERNVSLEKNLNDLRAVMILEKNYPVSAETRVGSPDGRKIPFTTLQDDNERLLTQVKDPTG